MTDPSATRVPSRSPATGDWGRRLSVRIARIPGTKRLLRLSLFWKIVLANVALATVAVGCGVGLARGLGGAEAGTVTSVAILAASAGILAVVLVNAVLVQLALSPLDDLARAARAVREGNMDARAVGSPLSDRQLRWVTDAFNEMLDSLSANQTRQQELARRVLESEERERQRIAHELYSGTAQTLAGVLVRLRIAERQLMSGNTGSIDEIRDEVVSALEEIRCVARRLRPPELDELGVKVALEAHARAMSEGRRLEINIDGDVPALSRESSLALFRIVQEAISNAAIHSDADTVTVTFTEEAETVVTEIVDDGRGFDPATVLGRAGQSLGLFGMHERAGYVQGELSLESGPGRGTRVRVVIPFVPRRDTPPVDEVADRLVHGLIEDEVLTPAGSTRGSSEPF